MNTGNKGKLFIVGIGPGGDEHITYRARKVIESSDTIAGYNKYIELIGDLVKNKEVISTPMTREIERCRSAINEALKGKTVSLVCSGDPGIYAMAGLVFEILKDGYPEDTDRIEVSVIPGVPALSAAASLLGAPLMHDFVSISLSDRLTPWEIIEKRLHSAAEADFVIVLYNPRSRTRVEHLKKAIEIINRYRKPPTPVGIVRAATRENEEVIVTTLSDVHYESVDMETILIIGNSETFMWNGFIVTPRGYNKKYDLLRQ
ncbi:MAG: precorrin-3B C(17)-methyltransferase [Nitrospirae bacterium]|nr:precorrin-3B C(17)-methyltransferase [Nitrospirota bacterium]